MRSQVCSTMRMASSSLKRFAYRSRNAGMARLRKFRRAAESAVARVVSFFEERSGVAKNFRRQQRIRRSSARRGGFEPRVDFVGGRSDFAVVRSCQSWLICRSTCRKLGTAVAVVRRKICAAEKRFQIRRQEHIERPAALAGRGLHERHVNFVHVGPFLAVHLDADEMFVEELRRSLRFRTIRAPSRGTSGRSSSRC